MCFKGWKLPVRLELDPVDVDPIVAHASIISEQMTTSAAVHKHSLAAGLVAQISAKPEGLES